MNVFDKIRWLTDKRYGLGIPMSTLGRYCGTHPTTVKFHLDNGDPVNPKTFEKYEAGINDLIKDFKKYVMEEE